MNSGDLRAAELFSRRAHLCPPGQIRWAPCRVAVAGFDKFAQALRDEVVPAGPADAEAGKLGSEPVVAEGELALTVADRSDREGRPRSNPIGFEAALGDSPLHRRWSRRLIDMDHEWFRRSHKDLQIAAFAARSGDTRDPPGRQPSSGRDRVEQGPWRGPDSDGLPIARARFRWRRRRLLGVPHDGFLSLSVAWRTVSLAAVVCTGCRGRQRLSRGRSRAMRG
jgi:hypothetical protein